MRVQQIRNIGVFDGNAPASANEWEVIKRNGDKAIKNWIDSNMSYRSCVIVLVGEETASRKWVKYEIEKAWNDKKGLFGIFIHNLQDPRSGTCRQGANPFTQFKFKDGKSLSDVVNCYNPSIFNAYGDIQNNIAQWIEMAINNRA
jgi:hypothetical protein